MAGIADAFGTYLKSSIGGAAKGASAGSVVPGVGNLVGAGIGMTMGQVEGIAQLISAQGQKKQANNFIPQLYDSNQLAFMAELDQKRKALNSGADFAAGMGAIDATTAGTQQAIAGVTGGDTGGTIQALLSAQQLGNRAKNQVLANGTQQQNFYNTLYGDVMGNVAQRSLELQLLQSAQSRAQWAQGQQDAFANLNNSAARMGDINWLDIFARHGQPGAAAGLNPEQQARQLNPIVSTLSQMPVEDPGLAGLPFDFSTVGLGATGGIPVGM